MIMFPVAPQCLDIDARESSLVSEEYRREWEGVRRELLERSLLTAQNWTPLVVAALEGIRSEYAVEDWDGEGAEAVSEFAVRRAERVAAALNTLVPPGIPAPELTPSHDGEITLSWIRSSRRMFSISVGAHCNMNFAGRIREGFEPHDVARFDTEDPSPLLRMASFISQLYSSKIT